MLHVNLASGLDCGIHAAMAALPSSDKSAQLFGDILPWLLVLVGLILAGGVLILILRRRLHDADSAASPGFTLHELRQLHAAGELTDDEFERAKAQMIGSVKTAAKPKPKLDIANPHHAAPPQSADDAYRAGKHGLSDQESAS